MGARLRRLKITRIDAVDKGANQKAHILLVKRDVAKDSPSLSQVHVDKPIGEEWDNEYGSDEQSQLLKGTLSAGDRNALPDSAFAAVWSDADGKKQRKFPFKHKDGSVDLPHLRNALARLEQHPNLPDKVKSEARAKLEAAAKANGVGEHKQKRVTTMSNFLKRLTALLKEAEAGADGVDGQGDGKELPDAHHQYLQSAHKALSAMVDAHKGADGSLAHLPKEHHIHKVKEALDKVGETLAAYGKQPGDGGVAEFDDVPDEGGPDAFGREPKSRNAATKRLTDVEKRAVEAEKRAKDAETRATAAEAIAKSERDRRETDEMRAELRKFQGVAIDVEKDAESFRALKAEKPELYERVMKALKGADATVNTSKVFDEFGSARVSDGQGTAWALIEAEAKNLVSKSQSPMTLQKAIDRVMKMRPDLVQKYYDEIGR